MHRFKELGLPETQDGWYLAPGRIDRITWGLLGFFVLIMAFLLYFSTLGTA